MAQQLTYLAERQGAASRGLAAQAAVGTVALLRGDFGAAWGPLEHYLAAIDTSPHTAPTFYGGHHVRITHFAWMVRCLWGMGYADQAQQCSA